MGGFLGNKISSSLLCIEYYTSKWVYNLLKRLQLKLKEKGSSEMWATEEGGLADRSGQLRVAVETPAGEFKPRNVPSGMNRLVNVEVSH